MVTEKIGIIGNGKIAVDIIKFITSKPWPSIQFVLFEPLKSIPINYLENLCTQRSVTAIPFEKINSPECISIIENYKPDLIFNINSYQIIKEPILSIPPQGIINFHNGPLPRYGGVNIPSWVIINREETHGVTWHFMDTGIDSGRIVFQKLFPVPDNYTAADLMRKCIVEGINVFMENFDSLVAGQLTYAEQVGERSYYSRKDKPENDGFIDLSQSYENINRLVRALTYFPFNNTFCEAKLKIGLEIINPLHLEPVERKTAQLPGKIIKLNDQEFVISCLDKNILITDFFDNTGERNTFKQLYEKYGSRVGAFHNLYQPQREANLRARLKEYLRFGLETGIFYAS